MQCLYLEILPDDFAGWQAWLEKTKICRESIHRPPYIQS